MTNDSIIIKYYEEFSFGFRDSDSWPQWARLTAVPDRAGFRLKVKSVTKREALAFIRENGLECALECEYGKVWDTPGRDFQARYKGIRIPEI